MKRYKKLNILIALIILSIAATCLAESTLKKFGEVKGRNYHKELYDDNNCAACHATKKPVDFPADNACMECHELKELVKATERKDEDKWQNPHNNLHYGMDVPCMECHGEHSEREPMCNDCHKFKFPNHKK